MRSYFAAVLQDWVAIEDLNKAILLNSSYENAYQLRGSPGEESATGPELR